MLTANQIRQKYLDFFKSKGHAVIASASLVPDNDPSTLFTGSGMQPMVPYLLGEAHPQGSRIVDSQKCFRSQDIEEVGDNRHTTFFEMIGNWSLGDYFKQEQITWMFEFLTKEIGLDPKNLYVTVFRGNEVIPRDEESIALWQECFASAGIEAPVVDDAEERGLQDGRIFSYPEKKNWWSRSGVPEKMPVGEPGGPDTEMFWDFGAGRDLHEKSQWKDEPCHVNCDCGRFLEIGNNVFMEFIKTDSGFKSLPQRNVDFGGGLERIAAASANEPDIFKLDLFSELLREMQALSGKNYEINENVTRDMRVIMDHFRAAVFLIADGVLPSNKEQGYIVRKLIRRAVARASELGIDPVFLPRLTFNVLAPYTRNHESPYTYLLDKKDFIDEAIKSEVEKFGRSLGRGKKELQNIYDRTKNFTATDAFNVYQNHGFPWEVSFELMEQKGISLDREQFTREFDRHREVSRAGGEQKFAGGLADHSEETTKLHTATHLLHQALRDVLGPHVEQRGSNITAERLRFDFSHGDKMTAEQIAQVEGIVNAQIQAAHPVHFELLSVEEAKARGAIGLFEDKYAELDGGQIKVYFMGDYSKEICGGPHVQNTKDLVHLKIMKEEAVSSGVRRIKAVLG